MFPSVNRLQQVSSKTLVPATSGGDILSGTAFTAATVLTNGAVLFNLSGNLACAIVGVTIVDQSKQNQPVDLYFFSGSPTGTVTTNTALVESVADAKGFLGKVSVAAGTTFTNETVQTVNDGSIKLLLPDLKGLYVVPVLTGSATPTFTAGKGYNINLLVESY
jgi:hypothetical protein